VTFLRYVAVQLVAYGIDMGVFLSILNIGFAGPIFSNVVAKIAAGIFAFLLHQSFTFQLERKQHDLRQAFRYFLLLGINIPLSTAVLGLVLLVIDIPVAAKFGSDVICVLFSFWLSKIWVFSTDRCRIFFPTEEKRVP
jgi:putative flippase GtrA